jgi:transmembrane sensor
MPDFDEILIDKFFAGTATADEAEKVLDWFETADGEQFLRQRIQNDSEGIRNVISNSINASLTFDKIISEIDHQQRPSLSGSVPGRLSTRWLVAASFAVVVTGLATFALLSATFSDTADTENAFRVYSSDTGEQRLLTLSDGSKIRLNERSSIVIPEDFNRESRTLNLTGEAFFDIRHDELRPLTVHTNELSVRVLGTEFVVKSDSKNQNTLVAVSEGIVSVGHNGDEPDQFTVINEDMIGLYDHNSRTVTVEYLDVNNYLSWINGRIVFDGTKFEHVVRQLSHIYGKEHRLVDEGLGQLRLTADVSSSSGRDVLETIAHSLGIQFSINNDVVEWRHQKEES